MMETTSAVFDAEDDSWMHAAAEMVPTGNQEETEAAKSCLTAAQRSRAESNRQKALALRKARLTAAHPYSSNLVKHVDGQDRGSERKKETKLIDSNAGFFIEQEEANGDQDEFSCHLERVPGPIIEPDRPNCLELCDQCRDTGKDGKHELITRTDSKKEFLLKDCDLDVREPPLKFIVRKNPHNPRGGDMKLYLRVQVEERALQVWGTEEALEKELMEREDKKLASKAKKFNKQLKDLRMQVRGSLFKKNVGSMAVHQHEFGPESYDEESDLYRKTCTTCGHSLSFEKM